MKNRMQDLDFEQNVAFDKVQEYEFTRRAAQRFRQVVSLDSFEDEDADVIFHYLYKEMELVSFGDHTTHAHLDQVWLHLNCPYQYGFYSQGNLFQPESGSILWQLQKACLSFHAVNER